MMHDREKSDSAIVAMKPTNKAVAPKAAAAESVEPRAGAKRNASEQSTHRTQGRARVTQALDRVRQAARQRKKEKKFTALHHHLSIDLFRESFLALKRDAAPGVDDMTWRSTPQTLSETSLICMHGSIGEHIGHCPRAGYTYRRRTEGSGRWRWPRSRIRSSRERRSRC